MKIKINEKQPKRRERRVCEHCTAWHTTRLSIVNRYNPRFDLIYSRFSRLCANSITGKLGMVRNDCDWNRGGYGCLLYTMLVARRRRWQHEYVPRMHTISWLFFLFSMLLPAVCGRVVDIGLCRLHRVNETREWNKILNKYWAQPHKALSYTKR